MKSQHSILTKTICAATLVRVLTASSPGAALDHWQLRNPAPQLNHLNAVAHGNGITVAVGNAGAIVRSTDGTNWFSQRVGSTSFASLAYGNGRFVAVISPDPYPIFFPSPGGASAQVSTNGRDWSAPASISSAPARISFGNGHFVALSSDQNGTTRSHVSTNGINWTVTSSNTITTTLRGVAFGNGRFVGIASGSIGGTFLVSADGTNWSITTRPIRLIDICYDNGSFYGAGVDGVFQSSDGVTWLATSSDITGPSALTAIAAGGNRFVAQGSQLPRPTYGNLVEMSSSGGMQWETNAPSANGLTRDICWTGTKYAAVGDAGRISTSDDGLTWTHNHAGPLSSLRGLAWNGQLIVAVGGTTNSSFPSWFNAQAIFVSTDAVHWTFRRATNAPPLSDITHGNGIFLAVGDGGTTLRSADAVSWTPQNCGTTAALRAVTFAGGKFVAVGDGGAIATSADGINWSLKNSGVSERLNGITYGGGLYLAVGQNGTMTTSADGDAWSPRSSGVSDHLLSAAHGNGRFVVVGNNRLWSTNGVNWIAVPFTGSWATQTKVVFVNGGFFSIGVSGYSFSSSNGAAWESRTIPPTLFPTGFYALLEYRGSLLAAGDYSAIAQSENFAPALTGTPRSGGFELTVAGETGRSYRVQATTDLVNWTELGSLTWSPSNILYLDATAPNFEMRLYRVVSP
jgi:hypothetical protein